MELSPRKSGEPANDQPVTVEPDRLEVLLADLYYLEPRSGLSGWISDSERRTPLIQNTNLGRLSRAISQAFTDAGPGEDIVVGLEQARRDGSGSIGGYRLTAFRIFVADNRLNLLFGAVGENSDDCFHFRTIHRQAQTQDSPGGISRKLVREKAGSRSMAVYLGSRVLYSGAEENIQRLREDWVALDLNERSGERTRNSSPEPDPEVDGRDQSKNRGNYSAGLI